MYIAVNVLLVAVNLLAAPEQLWFYWPMPGWGIGVIAHGAGGLLYFKWSSLVGHMAERELRRLQGE